MKKQKLSGAEGFESYYLSIFGERWQSLKAALLEERKPEVKAEIIKYVKTNTEKGNNVVIQTVIDVKNGATTKNLPIEKLSVSLCC